MIITREKGMRMWGGGSGNTSVSGASSGGGFSLTVAEGEGTGNAYTDFTYESGTLTLNKATEFVTVDFFNKLFTAYDANGNVIAPNNTTPTLDNIKFKAGAWTEQYLSALGQNSSGGGGGGGIELSDVWQSLKTNTDDYANQKINSAHIPDLSGTYATKTWVNQQGFVTSSGVTSVAMTVPTGLSVSGSPITSTGTLALTFTSGYSIPTNTKQSNWDTAYGWGNHATAGYAIGTTSIIAGNGLTGGGTLAADRTLSIQLQTNSGLAVSSSGLKLDIINNLTTKSAYKAISATQAKKIWDLLNQMFTLEGAGTTASPYVIKANYGLYTEQFLSALGQNSSGGGSGDFDEAQMWAALQSTSGTYATTKIATTHIPDMASTYGYLKSSALSGYATQAWVNQQGFLTTHQTLYTLSIYGGTTKVLDFKPNANASIYIKAGGDISLTNDTTNKYITLSYTHPTNGANTTISAASGKVLSAITVNSLGHVTSVSSKTLASADIPDLSGTYATASRATTLEGYFNSGGVAKVAAKLSTVSKKAWGQTYWTSGGVPQDVDGTLTISGGELQIWNTADTSAENRWDMRFGWTREIFQMWAYEGAYHDLAIGNTAAATATYKGLYYDASEKMWGIGTTTPAYTFDVKGSLATTSAITLAGTSASTRRIYFGDTSHYIELTSTGFHFSHGVYSDSFVSALGSNSSGGGSGTFDEEAMWTALGTTSTAKVIASSHIPNLSASKITSGTLAAARIPNLSWSKITSDKPTTLSGYGVLDDADGRYYALYGGTKLNNSLSSTNKIDLDDYVTPGSYYCGAIADSDYISNKPIRGAFRMWVTSSNGVGAHYRQRYQLYNSMIAYERWKLSGNAWTEWYTVQNDLANYASASDVTTLQGYFTNGVANNAAKLNNQSASYYATASSVTTLQGYFTNGVANSATSASKLTTTSKTAWGQTYWTSGGVPTNISGSLVDVSDVTINNNCSIYFKDSGGTTRSLFGFSSSNNLGVGSGTVAAGGSTIIYGTNIIFRANGTSTSDNAMYITSDKNVGIGTSSPGYKLGVVGTFGATGAASFGSTLSVTGASNLSGNISTDGHIYMDNNKHIYMKDSGGTSRDIVWVTTTNNLHIGYGSAAASMSTCINGYSVALRYGTSRTVGLTLTSNGAVSVANSLTAGGEVTASSDERKKNIISNTKFNVRDIASARSILYEWNDDRDKDNEKKIHGGSIAQDWLGKADSFLSQDDDGFYSINYGALALCSAITIAREVLKHEDRITLLEKENARLKARVAELEERRA